MEIHLERHDPEHHHFVVVRDPFPRVDVLLESRSMLLHDLVHYAVEASGRLDHGFYGLLAAGVDPAVLRGEPGTGGPAAGSGVDADVWARLMEVEGRVVRLQSAHRRGERADDPASRLLVAVTGAWAKTRMGDRLVLSWPEPGVRLTDRPCEP
ncbi:MAG: hypothetical protein R3F61_06325 [Myxococcota bacterium]